MPSIKSVIKSMEIYINLYFLHFESRMPQAECFRLRRKNYIIFVCCEAAALLFVFKIFLPILYFAQARIELRLRAFFGGEVIFPADQAVGQALHIRQLFFGIVRILIALTVVQLFH